MILVAKIFINEEWFQSSSLILLCVLNTLLLSDGSGVWRQKNLMYDEENTARRGVLKDESHHHIIKKH